MVPILTSELLDHESLHWTFDVPVDSPFFAGHFPGFPILPGVVALGWMLAAAERFAGRPRESIELLNVKFQEAILPGAKLGLTIVLKTGGRLQATIRSEAGIHASALIPGQEG